MKTIPERRHLCAARRRSMQRGGVELRASPQRGNGTGNAAGDDGRFSSQTARPPGWFQGSRRGKPPFHKCPGSRAHGPFSIGGVMPPAALGAINLHHSSVKMKYPDTVVVRRDNVGRDSGLSYRVWTTTGAWNVCKRTLLEVRVKKNLRFNEAASKILHTRQNLDAGIQEEYSWSRSG